MDPNMNLSDQLRLADSLVSQFENGKKMDADDAYDLAVLVIALNEWITGGGFLPTRWKK